MPLRTGNQRQPPNFPQQKSSNIIPPPHWHAKQDETFLVISGRMVATVSGQQKLADVNQEVFIRRGEYHTFANASSHAELVVDVKLNPDNRLRDEAFFRNAYGYLDDVTKAGKSPSLFQTFLFLWSADVIPALPGPKLVMAPAVKIHRVVWRCGSWEVDIGIPRDIFGIYFKRIDGDKERFVTNVLKASEFNTK